jgi:hypothetical protein
MGKFHLLETMIEFAFRATGRYFYGAVGAIVMGIVVALVLRAMRADKDAAEARQQAESSVQAAADPSQIDTSSR